MTSAAKRQELSCEYFREVSETHHHANRASCAQEHCGWRAATAYPCILQAVDTPPAYRAISVSPGLDMRKETAPTPTPPRAPVSPKAARGRLASPDPRHTKLCPVR